MGRNKKKGRGLPQVGPRTIQNVWLVQPPVGGGPADLTPPLGALLLAAILERAGKTPHLADLNLLAKQGKLNPRRSLRNQFVQALPKRPHLVDLIGITTWSYNFDLCMEFVEAIRRKHPQAPIVLGGPHVTFVDEQVLSAFPTVAYVLRDEGDLSFLALIEALEAGGEPGRLEGVPGLSWRRPTGELVRNPSGAVLDDLDSLPYPAYHLLDVQEYLRFSPVLVIEAGRGCPYNCNFCSTSNMFARRYRVKSAPRLVDEIEWLMEHSGSNRFELLHDNLVAKGKYVLALCQEIRARNLDVAWSCTSRPDNMNEELAHAMFMAGCESIFYGVETLDAERQKWTGKRLVPEKIEAAIALTRRQHVEPSLGIIVGFPEESAAEFDATLEAAFRWATDPAVKATVSTAMLRLYPGADLFQGSGALRFDALAARDSAALEGYAFREEWRAYPELFPLQAIHTDPDETRRNLLRRNLIRVLLKVCPHTARAAQRVAALGPRGFLDRLIEAREAWESLERPEATLRSNESLCALGSLVQELASPQLSELFSCEVPFWETTPIASGESELEHVIKPKRFEQEDLLRWARGELEGEPNAAQDLFLLAIRAGAEAVVWFTPQAETLWATFRESYAQDRAGTVAYVNGLRRGLA